MGEKLTIAHWSEDDQPREKLRDKGPEALSNAELLAILIGSGTPGTSAVELMQTVLNSCKNNLNTLGKMSIRELMQYKGIGEAKAITILAACEMGKRRQQESAEERPDIGTATRIYNHMHPILQMRIAHGGITEVSVDIRIIMREALLAKATILAVCHNHPSGSLSPSRQDDDITRNLQQACSLLRIHFLDHVIVTDGAYYSYHEEGRL